MRDIITAQALPAKTTAWNAPFTAELFIAFDEVAHRIHADNLFVGWWEPGKPRNFGELIALIQSEISEAMEAGRKDKQDDHLPQYSGVTVELADALIRIFDLAGALNLPLGEAMQAKLIYNQQRADHKRENREKEGGKQF